MKSPWVYTSHPSEDHAESYCFISINSYSKKSWPVLGDCSKQLPFCAKGKGLGQCAFLLSTLVHPPSLRPSSVSRCLWEAGAWHWEREENAVGPEARRRVGLLKSGPFITDNTVRVSGGLMPGCFRTQPAFSTKHRIVNILGFTSQMVSVTATQHCHCPTRAVVENK